MYIEFELFKISILTSYSIGLMNSCFLKSNKKNTESFEEREETYLSKTISS